MKNEIYNCDRYFTVFDVLTSHSQLLLRSQKSEVHSFNIDIIFFDTEYIQLSHGLYGVSIQKTSDKNNIAYKSVVKYLSYDGNFIFEIISSGEVFYVAAAFVKVFENELEFNESSLHFDKKGREREIASSLLY